MRPTRGRADARTVMVLPGSNIYAVSGHDIARCAPGFFPLVRSLERAETVKNVTPSSAPVCVTPPRIYWITGPEASARG